MMHDTALLERTASASNIIRRRRSRGSKLERRVISITNATFAKVTGRKHASREAIPIYRIRDDFFVPASHRDYIALRRNQERTDVKKAKITFLRANPKLSDPRMRGGGIRITMPSRGHEYLCGWAQEVLMVLNAQRWMHCGSRIKIHSGGGGDLKLKLMQDGVKYQKVVSPDASLCFHRTTFPFFILEAAYSQSRKSLQEKAHYYVQGSKGHLKILAMLEMFDLSGGPSAAKYGVKLTVWRIRKVSSQGNTGSYRMEHEVLCEDQEVYPTTREGSLRIYLTDILPVNETMDVQDGESYAEIEYDTVFDAALNAVACREAADAIQARRCAGELSSSFDANQDVVPLPSEATEKSPAAMDVEFLSGDDSEGDDPTWVEG